MGNVQKRRETQWNSNKSIRMQRLAGHWQLLLCLKAGGEIPSYQAEERGGCQHMHCWLSGVKEKQNLGVLDLDPAQRACWGQDMLRDHTPPLSSALHPAVKAPRSQQGKCHLHRITPLEAVVTHKPLVDGVPGSSPQCPLTLG